jgi:carbon storage regulator CsrA
MCGGGRWPWTTSTASAALVGMQEVSLFRPQQPVKEDRAMLVLTRKAGEQIQIGDAITITVTGVSGSCVKIGIDAPAELGIARVELLMQQDSAGSYSAATGE